MIGIIGAMSVETEALKKKLANARTELYSGMEFVSGELEGKRVTVAQCGVGKVFAAICAQTMILKFGVKYLINTGVGGALSKELDILDVAIADGVVQHDMDTSPLGDPVGLISGINKVILPTSDKLSALAAEVAERQGVHCVRGVIASGDQFISDAEKKQFIFDTFGAVCCEMEGAAIGQTCFVNGVEALIVRSISDSASGMAKMEYPEMVKRAAAQSQRLIEEIIREL